jgi:hypothetical protein
MAGSDPKAKFTFASMPWSATSLKSLTSRALAIPEVVEHWSPTTLRGKLATIGAKVVRQERYITFQLAEVAVPRTLFVEILRLIDGLRPVPAPP